MNEEEIDRQIAECRQKALANFPLKLIETTGDKAFAKWAELKLAGQGAPVVLGADDEDHAFGNLLLPFGPEGAEFSRPRTVEDILKDAAAIRFPEDLAAKEKVDRERYLAEFKANLAADPNMPLPTIFESKNGTTRGYSRAETIAAMEAERREPPLGEWPTEPETSLGLSVAYDILTNTPLSKVYIGIAPTDDWTTIPAWLRWGGWNECPAAEYHVAAMRRWRDLYGAELVGMSFDTINLRVRRPPKSRDEALALAREQYVYCSDIIDQGVQSYSALAATLMADDWWYFWWD